MLSLSVTLSQSMIDNMLTFTQLKRALAAQLYMSDAVPLPTPPSKKNSESAAATR